LKSNRSEESSARALPEPIPRPLADALTRSRERLGVFTSTVLFFPTIGSTNDAAAGRSPERLALGEGAVVFADEQTAGRGRRGRMWFSPPGSGLYVSVVLAPSRSADPRRATTLLTLAAGVALAEAIEAHTSLSVDLKWPNDLYIRNKKVGGILAELHRDRRRSVLDTRAGYGPRASPPGGGAPGELRNVDTVVLGYGINVRQAAYPPEISDRATSLESELGRAVDRYELLVETLAGLSTRYEDLVAGRFDVILDAWRRRAPGARGARVTWMTGDGLRNGVTAGIDDDGALLVHVDGRVERIVGGEVRWS
jgi:BirA family biotin operon repressor/biotin-[acetyl-CoA-carboxylase] ligase